MELKCPYCQRPIPADHVNVSAGVATCSSCNKAFQPSSTIFTKPSVGTVKGIDIYRSGNELFIVRRWFSVVAYFLIFFCVVWDAFLVFWYTLAFTDANSPWIMKVFPIGHVAVGLGLTYYTLCLFLNKTSYIVRSGQLEIRHSPLPWMGSGIIKSVDIDQIYVEKKIHYNRGSTTTSFNLLAQLKSGTKRKLATGISDYEQAVKIEQEIEKNLGIADRPVSGEFNG